MAGKKKSWSFLGSSQLQNIIGIVTLVATIFFGFLTYTSSKGATAEPGEPSPSVNGWILTAFIIFLAFSFVNLAFLWKKHKKLKDYEIVQILIDLQNRYLFNSKYTTAGEHAATSKETELKQDGEARILTNSLSYDYNFCVEIANNIFDGAVYTYLLPNTDKVFTELDTYIVKLQDELFKLYKPGKNATQTNTAVNNALRDKLNFAFFDKSLLCLYNFARFNQGGDPGFFQSWWYINPTEPRPTDTSQMLTHEINDQGDHDKLKTVFDLLQERSRVVNGLDVHTNHTTLETTYGRGR